LPATWSRLYCPNISDGILPLVTVLTAHEAPTEIHRILRHGADFRLAPKQRQS
jgi:hypothetical protein